MPEESAKTQHVRKMLVIGLGSTGTFICETFANRLIQEFGSLDRVPWVRFLCVETNAAQEGLLKDRGDLVPITISSQEYSTAMLSRESLDQAIRWSDWVHFSVLENIGDIEAGAGNIRMAGRLAFLYPRNFTVFLQEFQKRHNALQRLGSLEASQARGPLPGGADPAIVFTGNASAAAGDAAADDITIVVVGTLCGGTASGSCVDMGYFLKRYAPVSKRLAVFTLPRPDLSVASFSGAEKFKKNAHSALRELYHFSQIKDNPYRVKYPVDNDVYEPGPVYPYELITLAWPENGSLGAEEALRGAIAERLFINTFNTATDPFVKGIDGRAGQAYGQQGAQRHSLFCTFGLGVLEFPAPRLVEYGAARLLAQAIRPWVTQQQEGADAFDMAAAGITWEDLKRILLANDGGLAEALRRKTEAVVSNAKRNPASFTAGVDQIRLAFGDATGGKPDPDLAPNCVPARLRDARDAAVQAVWQAASAQIAAALVDWRRGPSAALAFVSRAQATLQSCLDEAPKISGAELPHPDEPLAILQRLHDDGFVRAFPPLYDKAATEACAGLRAGLQTYVDARVSAAVAGVFGATEDRDGVPMPGVLGILLARFQRLERRLRNLNAALQVYMHALEQQSTRLATSPPVNGVSLMDNETADAVYHQCLGAADPASLAAAEQRHAASILGNLRSLAQEMAAVDADCLWDTPRSATAGLAALPPAVADPLLNAARLPFQTLLAKNVVDQWFDNPDRDGIVATFLQCADQLMPVDDPKVALLGHAPITEEKVVVFANTGANAQAFAAAVGAGARYSTEEAVDGWRAIVMRERYCIPPEALQGVVAVPGNPNALENAKFETFNTASRRDEIWFPMSDRETERLLRYEELLAVGILIGAAEVHAGALEVQYPQRDLGGRPYRRLRANFGLAARQWAVQGQDEDSRELSLLESSLSAAISNRISADGGERFVEMLANGQHVNPPGLQGWAPEQIGRIFSRFCQRDQVLAPFHNILLAPDVSIRGILFYRQGQTTVRNVPAPEDGFRCVNAGQMCDELLGATEMDAAQRQWRCPRCGTPYDASSTVNAQHLQTAARLKG